MVSFVTAPAHQADAVSGVADAAVARLRDEGRNPPAIDLSVGEPDMPTPPAIVAAGVAALEGGATKYTPRAGLRSTRERIVAKLKERNGFEVSIDDVIATGGGTPAVAIAIGSACRPGDTILIPDPGWPNYEIIAGRLGVAARRYRQDPAPGVAFDLAEIEQLVDERTRMIVITSPSNPTGGVAGRTLVEGLVDMARRLGLLIVSDEAYESISFESEPVSPAACGGLDLTFACYTLSKTFAMTGWRIGYLVMPPGYASAALQMQIAIAGCASAMAQLAAEVALADEPPEVAAMVANYQRRRDLALSAASDAGLQIRQPDGAFYLWIDISATGMTGQEFTDRLLAEQDTLVSAGEVYSVLEPGHIRVSYAAPDKVVEEGMRRLTTSIVAWSSSPQVSQ
jgi:aspartate aminotransferase